ncbi:hypothetical protein FE257_010134 [Aspergillus nanangensis]|uniref:N-acetyltransferase domain-containing protein n=1 Tax=Aspergillus nanangensis TaxID=2582783 RepID=A0AAD4CJ81_ASPNN|nr:hypothetical protein FE257_010134 [Aspergillus nanangensis]
MTSSLGPTIYEHDTQIIPLLVAQLPHSCSVLRRIQHTIRYPSSTARILATFPPGTTPEKPWLAAHVDLFRGRETQILVYSSLEAEHSTSNESIDTIDAPDDLRVFVFDASPAALAQARAQFLSLLTHVKTYFLPEYLTSLKNLAPDEASLQNTDNNNNNLIPPPDPHAFLLGSLHTGLFALLYQSGAYLTSSPLPCLRIHRLDNPPYYKYIFPQSTFSTNDSTTLPPGYRYQDLHGRTGVLPSQFDLVQSRTHIPRPPKQLQTMPSVAIYFDGPPSQDSSRGGRPHHPVEDEDPVGWAFIGRDGALATLHVEPEHRGRGLALQLSKAVMRCGMDPKGVFGTGGGSGGMTENGGEVLSRPGDWAHTEVAQMNGASRRVMEKVGGQVMSTVVWAVVEMLD